MIITILLIYQKAKPSRNKSKSWRLRGG